MRKTNGFTLIELLIVIAIIVILALIVSGSFSRKAGAHEVTPDAIRTVLHDAGASYQWVENVPDSPHFLNIMSKGTATWENSEAACTALKPLDPTLSTLTVYMPSNDGVGELRWEKSGEGRKLTNLPTTRIASC